MEGPLDILWITQLQKDLNDKTITELECPAGTFSRLRDRIFPGHKKTEWKAGAILITLKDPSGDLTDDDPIVIADHLGKWMLKDFFSLPDKVWRKVKVSE